MAFTIQADSIVGLVYDLRDEDEQLLEARTPQDPLFYMHGRQQILPAIERAVQGQTPGYRVSLHLSADNAYGRYDQRLVAEVERRGFPPGLELRLGMKFNTKGPAGQPMIVRVVEVMDDKVVVDGNHPLAGRALNFELLVQSVRKPTEEELETGVPGPEQSGGLH